MCTDIEHTIKELENEINDLIMIGERPSLPRFQGSRVCNACPPSRKCSGTHCIKKSVLIDLRKNEKAENENNQRKEKFSTRESYSHEISNRSNNCKVEKTSSCPCPNIKQPKLIKLTRKHSKKSQSVYMSNKSSSIENNKPKKNIPVTRGKFKSQSSRFSTEAGSDKIIYAKQPIPPQDDNCTQDDIDQLKTEISKVKSELNIIKTSQTAVAKKTIEDLSKELMTLKNDNQHMKETLKHKKQQYDLTVRDLNRVKDLLNIYEEKVGLLHEKAIVSSKVMNESKDKFCKCLQDKDKKIKKLLDTTKNLKSEIKEKDDLFLSLNKKFKTLETSYNDPTEVNTLKEANDVYCQCIKELENKLQHSTDECDKIKSKVCQCNERIKELEKVVSEKCNCGNTFEPEIKRLQENETRLNEEITYLTKRIGDVEAEKLEKEVTSECEYNRLKRDYNNLQNKYSELMSKYDEYEECAKKCEKLERQCKCVSKEMQEKESTFQNERNELRSLVDQLTSVVEQNKHTLLHLSDVNKQQEDLLHSQNETLYTKDKRIQEVESEYEMIRKKSEELEKEVEELMKTLSGSCTSMTCSDMRQRVIELMDKLNEESENLQIKNKIIEDQAKTIENLQTKIKEHTREIRKSKEIANVSVAEIYDLNEELKKKEILLEKESQDKEVLTDKLKKLEQQKNQLVNEMEDLECWIKNCQTRMNISEAEKIQLEVLQKQIDCLKMEWQKEKSMLCQEKEKAASAAKFATQRLVETVSDFQKQICAQKKVQSMLTSMLHQKEEQLRVVTSKMSSINAITYAAQETTEMPLQQLFKCSCHPSTTTNSVSAYSTCSDTTPVQSGHTKKKFCCHKCNCR